MYFLTNPAIQCLRNQRVQKTYPKPPMLWNYIFNDPISRPRSRNKHISLNRHNHNSNRDGTESNWLVFTSNFEDHIQCTLFQNLALKWLIVIVKDAVHYWCVRANIHNCIAMICINVALQNAWNWSFSSINCHLALNDIVITKRRNTTK